MRFFELKLLKRKFLSILIFALLTFQYCSSFKYDVTPDIGNFQYSRVKMKVYYKNKKNKQSGKLLLKYDNNRTKMLLLSPLNQILFELIINREDILLINSKNNKYWQGNFNSFLKRVWNIDLGFRELRLLILEGIEPENIVDDHLKFKIEKDKGSGKPKIIRINGDNIFVKLKVINKRVRNGKLDFNKDLSKLHESDIDDVLRND